MQMAVSRPAAWLRPAALLLRTSHGFSNVALAHRPLLVTAAGRRQAHVADPPTPAAGGDGKMVDPAAPPADAITNKLAKRKVAMFVGYEGTDYRGLQMQVQMVPEDTVEDTLEEAIFKAGGILESNRGQQSKVAWSRSSRTDKSVHSLATVVALKMEVESDSFETDPEGQAIAVAINSHLPSEVRVFSIQRVSKKWNARSECIRRSYQYYLPASVLGLALDGSEADRERLERLAAAWGRFQGTHPFHNYTKRRLYREIGGGRGPRRDRRGDADAAASSIDSDSEAEEAEEAAASSSSGGSASGSGAPHAAVDATTAAVASSLSYSAEAVAAVSSSSSISSSMDGGSSSVEGEDGSMRGLIKLDWKHERDNADPVVRRHFRYIEWCRADTELRALVPGGQPCVMLSLQGGSFMLHQIRKMVAMAVAVARGGLPLELLEASLATPARLNIPLAPPSTLVLVGAQFSPFKRSWSGQSAVAAQFTGEVLELKEAGTAAQQHFLQATLQPALDTLLAGEEWRKWGSELDRLWVDPAELEALLATFSSWRLGRQEAAGAAKAAARLEEEAARGHRGEDS